MGYYLIFTIGLLVGFALGASRAAEKDEAGRQRIEALENENQRLRRALEDFKR